MSTLNTTCSSCQAVTNLPLSPPWKRCLTLYRSSAATLTAPNATFDQDENGYVFKTNDLEDLEQCVERIMSRPRYG